MNKDRNLADYFQAHRGDEEEWSEEADTAPPDREPSSVYSLRLRASDLAELRKAAVVRGVSLSELIRTAALAHVRESEIAGVDISAGRVKFFSRDERTAGTKGSPNRAKTFADTEVITAA